LTAAGAAAATGVRVFTATSSQGLVYGLEVLYTLAGWRVPLVLVNVSRGLSAPITLGPDHNDVLAARDTGFLQLHAETCQEVVDFILMAYRLAESSAISAPVLVNLDGFQLSFTREAVELPSAEQAGRFLGPFQPLHPGFRHSHPVAQGVAVLDGATYSYFRYQLHRAVENGLVEFPRVAAEFAETCGRSYTPLELYQADDAEIMLVMIGSYATKAKAAIDRWRSAGRRVGLTRLRLVRPLPVAELRRALAGRRAVGVLDQNLSPGLGGILFQEVAGAVAGMAAGPAVLRSFIGGLGGKDISDAEFDHLLATLDATRPADPPADVELLMTQGEWRQVARSLTVAGKADVADVADASISVAHSETGDGNHAGSS
jgi:pyruvate ferredoxin oxidoreductase alpha subunit